MQRLRLGAFCLVFGNGSGLNHRVEHEVAALDGAVGVANRREIVGPLDHPGEECAFRQVKLAHVFAKVGLRGLAESVDGETAALAKVDLVGVELEELLLVEAVLQLESNDDLDDFPFDAFLGSEKESASCMVNVDRPAASGPWSRRG
jgi:hypothetical protein